MYTLMAAKGFKYVFTKDNLQFSFQILISTERLLQTDSASDVLRFYPIVDLCSCCMHLLHLRMCSHITEIQTHGLPPEEPGREEDSPGALRWDRESYATWWGQNSRKTINSLTRTNLKKCTNWFMDNVCQNVWQVQTKCMQISSTESVF